MNKSWGSLCQQARQNGADLSKIGRMFNLDGSGRELDVSSSPLSSSCPVQGSSPLDKLQAFSANGLADQIAEQMANDTFVLSGIAISGQMTTLYGGPNMGKTLLSMWLLRDAIQAGIVEPKNIYYANCDDNYRGSLIKLEIAESIGFNMLVPDLNGFTAKQLPDLMVGLISSGQAKGITLILDTLKKFTDLMDKRVSTEFTNIARRFVAAGGTVISLAHVNKHKNVEGKSIHAGTTDIKDDSDCVYIIDLVDKADSPNGEVRTVELRNDKCRGDNDPSVVFQFTRDQGGGYEELLDSVRRLTPSAVGSLKKAAVQQQRKREQSDLIEAIKRHISTGTHTKTTLIKLVDQDTTIGRRKIARCLSEWERPQAIGGLWQVQSGANNAKFYVLHGTGLTGSGGANEA